MCASIHLSFKMEALKTASPTQGRLGPCALEPNLYLQKQTSIQKDPFHATQIVTTSQRKPFSAKVFFFFIKAFRTLQDDHSFVALQ